MFKHFQTRLIVLFGGVLALALAATFFAVQRASIANAHRVIEAGLSEDAAVFSRLLEEQTWHLLEAARLLASDFAFKSAYATGDGDTLLSAMRNHLGRISGGDWMMLVTPEGDLSVDTAPEIGAGARNPWPELIAAASSDDFGEVAGLVEFDGRLFRMMVVPLLVPELAAWILVGFEIDDEYARDLAEIIRSEVAILMTGGRPRLVAGTRASAQEFALLTRIADGGFGAGDIVTVELDGDAFISSAIEPSGKGDTRALVVLQRPLAAELAPFARLRTELLLLFVVALAAATAVAFFVARSVTRPVLQLAGRARRVVAGDYTPSDDIRRRDEIGMLDRSFNRMVRGLAERRRVRDLLGKVVSPSIAEELLSKEVELGGEERLVTVLFSDLRNFTSLAEGQQPREIIALLNQYLTVATGVIERHRGVVDKYMGDAVMALFGAPLDHPDDAVRAVTAGLEMHEALARLNLQLVRRGLPALECGTGIGTGRVVAGNVGTETRLNYTVIGDGVNLASRLESLTKKYRVPVIVDDATRRAAPDFVYRELDRVRVKGKRRTVSIFQPLGRAGAVPPGKLEEAEKFHAALEQLRAGDFQAAKTRFVELARGPDVDFYQRYADRADNLLQEPPGPEWDGSVAFADK